MGREGFDARAMSPSKALRLSLAKTAEILFEMPLSVTTVEQFSIGSTAIVEKLGDDGLLLLLDGATGQRGAIKLDTQFTAALIEAQIIGEVRATTASAREYTRTDAAMVAPFLDTVLTGFDEELSASEEDYQPRALRFGDKVDDSRVLGLALEGGRYDLYVVTVDLAEGAKTGVIWVLIPHLVVSSGATTTKKDADDGQGETLAQNALEATATLDAVLARLDMPLRDVWGLKVGMTLPISDKSIGETQLIAPGNHFVAEVRLGQLNGLRAVRFVSEGDGALDALDGPAQAEMPMAVETSVQYDVEMLPSVPDLAMPEDESAQTPPLMVPQAADG